MGIEVGGLFTPKGVSRRQARELGILPVQILARARKLHKDGKIEKGMDVKDIAALVALDAAGDEAYASAWDAPGAPNWDEILAFIEGVLKILVEYLPFLIALF